MRHVLSGPPDSRMIVFCATKGLRFDRETAPLVRTALQTYFSV